MKTNYNYAVVTKSNDLVEASYRLSGNEQKIILILIASLRFDDKEFKSFSISVRELNELLGLKHQNTYKAIRKLVLGLQKKTLSIYRENLIVDVNWLAAAKYHLDEGMVELRFDEDLKDYLLGLREQFTTYPFNEVIQFKSQFTFRIFDLLKQYETFKVRTLDLDELRRILKIEPNQYIPYANFKNRVLITAQKELREKSKLIFDFKEIKHGRKVVQIKFLIKKQAIEVEQLSFPEMRDIEEVEIDSDLDKLIALLPESYRTHQTVRKLLRRFLREKNFDYVARNIEYANANSNAIKSEIKSNRRSNYRGYLRKTLEEDFGLAYQEDLKIQEEKEKILKEQEELRKHLEEEKERKVAAEKRATAIEENQKDLAKKHLESLSKAERKKLEVEAFEHMDSKMKKLVFNKTTGWKMTMKIKMISILKDRLFSN